MATVAASRSPLVGRETELEVLRTAVATASERHAQVVVLSGQAGVGKTRLAQECLAAAQVRGFRTLQGGCGALHQDLTYAPLVEALRPLVRQQAQPGRPALVEGLLDLGRLFGDLSLPPGPELGDPGLGRTRLFESVCRLLERATTHRPVALLLDDVHWADRGSLALLHYLLRSLADRPLLILLTYRAGEAEPALNELLAGLRRDGSVTELRLAGLTDAAVRVLTDNLLDGEAPDGLLDVLAARSGGVPLFVGALVGSLVESGALHRHDDRWALAAQPPQAVPAAVSALLRSQVEQLPAEARQVLDLLAVCGAQADHALLERLASGDNLLRGVAGLRAAGLITEEEADGQIRYRAGHPLVCEVAYDLLPLIVRRRRHADVARAVARYAPDQLGLHAHHVRRAGGEIDPGHALQVLLGAADHALARKAGDEALANVRASIELAEALVRHELLPGLLDQLAEAHRLVGDRQRAVQVLVAAAARTAPGIDRAERLHRAASLEVEAGNYQDSLRYLNEAAPDRTDARAARLLVSIALTRMHIDNRSGDNKEVAAGIAGLEELKAARDLPRAQAAILVGRGHLAVSAGRYAEARTHLAPLLDLAPMLGDELAEGTRRPMFFVELCWGDLPAARSLAEDGLRLARQTGVPSFEAAPRLNLGIVAFYSGQWEHTLRRCREVIDLASRVGLPRSEAMALALRGLVLVRRGRIDDALGRVDRARAAVGPQSLADRHLLAHLEVVQALVALARGDAREAAATAAESLRRHTTLPVSTLLTLAEAQLALGDLPAASGTADILAGLGPGAPYPGALAAWVRGRVDRDRTPLRRAADELRALGFVYEAAVARLDLAELCQDGGDELPECLCVLERLGAQPEADRARSVLRRLGLRPPVPPRQRRTGGLSPREEQVARLVADGLSNPEIAGRLYLSPRTVTTHLQNVYGRLELRSRAALIRYVLEELPPDTPNT